MLTDAACRKAKPNPDGKERKMPDSLGLMLVVTASGYKVWRFKYRIAGKEKKLVIGPYPDVSLSQARAARDQARSMLADGIDPAIDKKQRRAKASVEAKDTFEATAKAWHKAHATTLTERYARQILDRLKDNVFPELGAMPIRKITAPLVLKVLRAIEEREAYEMAHRVRGHMSDVFVWAIAAGMAEIDPADMVGKALHPRTKKRRPALLDLGLARDLIIKTERMPDTYWGTLLASRLLALTAARPGIVRLAERSEFEGLDGLDPIWRVPAEKMKLTRERKQDVTFEFVIPLAAQSVAVVKAAMAASPGERWLFPSISGWRKPMSDSTISKMYRTAGYTGKHVPHGWRSTFSTIMNKIAAQEGRVQEREVIDLMLAHMSEGVEPIYNRYLYMPHRRALAHAWADMLMKGLPEPETLTLHLR